ncbi:MAG: hypothetical protein LBH98_06245 [Chitinispirillales bacterium]|jgi:hypothetical protein|nr:hypothetical protein [Chitinispirillales bacterium]
MEATKQQIWEIMDEITEVVKKPLQYKNPYPCYYLKKESNEQLLEQKMQEFDKSTKGQLALGFKTAQTLSSLYNEINAIHAIYSKIYYDNDDDIKNIMDENDMIEAVLCDYGLYNYDKDDLELFKEYDEEKRNKMLSIRNEIQQYAKEYKKRSDKLLRLNGKLLEALQIANVPEYTGKDVLNMGLEIGKEYEVFSRNNGWEVAVLIKITKKNLVFERAISGMQRLLKIKDAGYMIRFTGNEKKHISYAKEFMW